jgi:hypothetical protein
MKSLGYVNIMSAIIVLQNLSFLYRRKVFQTNLIDAK